MQATLIPLFKEAIVGDVMYLILTLRNNNAYIDQAKQYLLDGDKETFAELCEELVRRCDDAIERAQAIAASLTPSRWR